MDVDWPLFLNEGLELNNYKQETPSLNRIRYAAGASNASLTNTTCNNLRSRL